MIPFIIVSWFIIILIEVVFAGEKIRTGISPKAQMALRIILGIASNLFYIFENVPYLFLDIMNGRPIWYLYEYQFWLILSLNTFLVFGYWNFFDGFLNIYRGKNWFTWGKTKIIDRFFSSGEGFVLHLKFFFGHFIKWTGTLMGLIPLLTQ